MAPFNGTAKALPLMKRVLFSDQSGFLGTVEMRDPSGLWHVIVSEELSECAQHSYAGVPSEQTICLDWSKHIEHFQQLMAQYQ